MKLGSLCIVRCAEGDMEMENDLISRSELREAISGDLKSVANSAYFKLRNDAHRMERAITRAINNAPAVDAEPVRHGRWHVCLGGKVIECTTCTGTFFNENGNELPNYCPNCGAKMDAEVEG